jgi:hypothetical protein
MKGSDGGLAPESADLKLELVYEPAGAAEPGTGEQA